MEKSMLGAAQADEIDQARAKQSQTRRPTVAALEDVLFVPIAVLDHGFVRVIDYMGDDGAIVQAARVSYGAGTRKVNEDRALIRYLMRKQHSSPFEMCEIKFHVKLPIFVARQWIRHRMASVNEYSARYSILDKEFYVPSSENLASQSRTNRQGRGEILHEEEAQQILEVLTSDAERSYQNYLWMINENRDGVPVDEARNGLARELARMNLTLNTYTQWYWKIDLHNLMHFLKLRGDIHAQYEIRAYADIIMSIVEQWVPTAFEAFKEYRLGGASLSGTALTIVRELVKGASIQDTKDLSARELRELKEILGL